MGNQRLNKDSRKRFPPPSSIVPTHAPKSNRDPLVNQMTTDKDVINQVIIRNDLPQCPSISYVYDIHCNIENGQHSYVFHL